MRSKLLLLGLLVLTGCGGDQRNRASNRFGDLGLRATESLPPTSTPRAPVIEPEVSERDLDTAISKVRTDFQASQNATTNSLTGLGAQITKVAETFEASLLRFTSEVNANFKAVVTANNEMRADFEAKLTAHAEVNTNAIARLKAQVDAIAQAQLQAQAGMLNKIESLQQTVSSGRDSIVNTNQYSDEMFKSARTSDRTNMVIVIVMSAALVMQAERSRARADRRACGDKGEVKCDLGLMRRFWRWLF